MTALRVGAVGYLNTRPLVHGLDRQPDRFALRFDVPSKCAALLHEKSIDLGLIPSIEYLHRPDYRIVPDISISSRGAVASVALFSTRPITAIRSIGVDSSSRTSVALLRVLCAQWFDIEPKFVTLPPDLPSMIKRCDAALLIGDPALFADHEPAGLDKIDLGEEWTAMTGLPFVWAFWTGRPGAVSTPDIAALQAARDAGLSSFAAIAAEYCKDDEDRARRAAAYLRDNVMYGLAGDERAGLRKFYDLAADLRLVANAGKLQFY